MNGRCLDGCATTADGSLAFIASDSTAVSSGVFCVTTAAAAAYPEPPPKRSLREQQREYLRRQRAQSRGGR
jgi:hypothetical protein